MCLGCGFDGPELQGERGSLTFVCPGCSADLYARPARSYAEMEGFVEARDPGVCRWTPARESLGARFGDPRSAARPLDARAVALAWAIGLLAFAGATLTILIASSAGIVR